MPMSVFKARASVLFILLAMDSSFAIAQETFSEYFFTKPAAFPQYIATQQCILAKMGKPDEMLWKQASADQAESLKNQGLLPNEDKSYILCLSDHTYIRMPEFIPEPDTKAPYCTLVCVKD